MDCDKKIDITKPVHFYDNLGRKISDNLNIEANKIYKKQLRQKEWESWKDIDLRLFWGRILECYSICTLYHNNSFWHNIRNKKIKGNRHHKRIIIKTE